MIIVFPVPVGYLRTNCYIFREETSKDCVIVDPGDEPKKIIKVIEEQGLNPKFILLTHGHFDHIYAIPPILERFPEVKTAAFCEEKELLEDNGLNCSKTFHRNITITPDVLLTEGETELAGARFTVLHTPGHTKGSASYYFPESGLCFTGDTLFYENIGRTDFPTGDFNQIISSIRSKLFTLPGETTVLPGHGESSTIAHEIANNYHFNN